MTAEEEFVQLLKLFNHTSAMLELDEAAKIQFLDAVKRCTPFPDAIVWHRFLSFAAELQQDYVNAIRHGEREVEMIVELHQVVQDAHGDQPDVASYALSGMGTGDLRQRVKRLDLLRGKG